MSSFLFSGARIEPLVANVGLLFLRVFAGLSLSIAHGMQKFPPSDSFVAGVTAMGFPAPYLFAWMATLTETFGGIAIALGLLTRPVALFLVLNFCVVGFIRHAADPYRAKELPFLFLATFFMFLCLGAGRFAVDRMVRRN
jgi:putative oxidoreductase